MYLVNLIDSLLPLIFEYITCPAIDFFMVFITRLGDGGFIWILTIALLMVSKRTRKVGFIAAVSLLICFITGNCIIKPLVGRIRPCNLYPELRMLIERPSDFSFPSMHTATSFSVSSIILMVDRKWGIPAIILSVLIALSRVYLNVHFTTDIIAGALYGYLIAVFINFVIKKTKFNVFEY